MELSVEYSQTSDQDNTQAFNIADEYEYGSSFQSSGTNLHYNEDYVDNTTIQNWEHLLGEPSGIDHLYADVSQSDSVADQTGSFGFQQQEYQYDQNQTSEEIHSEADYETIIRSRHLYYDPNPQIITKPTPLTPLVFNQNVMIRFLQPPPIPQGPLIIQEVRPPQPPPLPPLVIRQHAPPPPSPPPLILREKPPSLPPHMTAQVVTKVLPPIPPPPRSVIIERLPSLPAKPRDIIIERWIPYEAMYKRKVIVHRAEESKPYVPPKNLIITYEPVQTRVVRQVERLGISPEDPRNYSVVHGSSLLDAQQLISQLRELGITEDLSPPDAFVNDQKQHSSRNIDEHNFHYNISSEQQLYNNNNYAPTYENLIHGSLSSTAYEGLNEHHVDQANNHFSASGEDISTQLAQYGLTTETIPY